MSVAERPLTEFRLWHDAMGQLMLVDDAMEQMLAIVPVRAFPISDRDHWISICDLEGHEVYRIADLADVPAEMRTILEEELSRREFIPIIRRILSATREEPSLWSVETDRGLTTFQVNNEDDVRRTDAAQASILDSHGIRYVISDVRRLDRESREILEHFL